jgi:hypothetical protein
MSAANLQSTGAPSIRKWEFMPRDLLCSMAAIHDQSVYRLPVPLLSISAKRWRLQGMCMSMAATRSCT